MAPNDDSRSIVGEWVQTYASAPNLTPLQFQKQLGLIEARRLIVSSGMPLSQVAFEVGYESTSQFSREPYFKKSL